MFHRETNPYFIRGGSHPTETDGHNQPNLTGAQHVQPPHHGRGSQHAQHSKDHHPRFLLPTQGHDEQNHSHDPPHTLPEQHLDQHPQNMQQPLSQHSFQIPLQHGNKQKKPNNEKKQQSGHTPPSHSQGHNLPHIYVPHDTRHQEPQPRSGPRHQAHGLRVPHPRKTRPVTWFVAFFCAILWLIIFIGGLIVLLIYLIYRPHSPKYELSEVALNAAYLDMGRLLNADVRLLANFTNINKKVKVDFKDMVINLYYGQTLIATQYIKPFSETKLKHVLLDIHLVSSQVQLPLQDSQRLARQLDNNRMALQVKGFFRTRAAMIPSAKGVTHLQMKLVYNHMAPIILFLLQSLDCSCTCSFTQYFDLFHVLVYQVCADDKSKLSRYGRKASMKDFYSVILPSLQHLHGGLALLESSSDKKLGLDFVGKKKLESGCSKMDMEREEECGICLEPCTKMVLPNCCHSMCINCYRDWNTRSEACPFCRGSLKRVKSEDLWVLAGGDDLADTEIVIKDDLLRFYPYVNRLPKDFPDALSLVYYDYLI